MSEMKHTPLPWSLEISTEGDEGMMITIPEIERCLHDWQWADSSDWDRDLANAELITDAVNIYHANQQLITRLTEALAETTRNLDEMISTVTRAMSQCQANATVMIPVSSESVRRAREVIAAVAKERTS